MGYMGFNPENKYGRLGLWGRMERITVYLMGNVTHGMVRR